MERTVLARWRRIGVQLTVALGLLTIVSCGGGPEFHKVYPVKGKILVNNQPAADCLIYLNKTFDDPSPRRVSPYAVTDANGNFAITSYVTGDGAPEGEYVVTVEWRERSGVLGNNYDGMDRLDGAYAKVDQNKSKPGFVVKVARAPLELPPFELTQSPEAKKKHDEWKKRKRPGLGGGGS